MNSFQAKVWIVRERDEPDERCAPPKSTGTYMAAVRVRVLRRERDVQS